MLCFQCFLHQDSDFAVTSLPKFGAPQSEYGLFLSQYVGPSDMPSAPSVEHSLNPMGRCILDSCAILAQKHPRKHI